jgi:hypothetical protein
MVPRLAVVSELWNHYAAAVFKARFPRESMPTHRAARLAGETRMNFVNLVIHGLSAISVHAEVACVRLLVACGLAAGFMIALLSAVIMVRLLTSWTIPGWVWLLAATLAIVLVQSLGLAVSFVFLMLGSRSGSGYIPLRDYGYFVDSYQVLAISRHPNAECAAP